MNLLGDITVDEFRLNMKENVQEQSNFVQFCEKLHIAIKCPTLSIC